MLKGSFLCMNNANSALTACRHISYPDCHEHRCHRSPPSLQRMGRISSFPTLTIEIIINTVCNNPEPSLICLTIKTRHKNMQQHATGNVILPPHRW